MAKSVGLAHRDATKHHTKGRHGHRANAHVPLLGSGFCPISAVVVATAFAPTRIRLRFCPPTIAPIVARYWLVIVATGLGAGWCGFGIALVLVALARCRLPAIRPLGTTIVALGRCVSGLGFAPIAVATVATEPRRLPNRHRHPFGNAIAPKRFAVGFAVVAIVTTVCGHVRGGFAVVVFAVAIRHRAGVRLLCAYPWRCFVVVIAAVVAVVVGIVVAVFAPQPIVVGCVVGGAAVRVRRPVSLVVLALAARSARVCA